MKLRWDLDPQTSEASMAFKVRVLRRASVQVEKSLLGCPLGHNFRMGTALSASSTKLLLRPMLVADSSDMAARGRIGGFARAAKYSPEELTGSARAGFLRRFEPDDPSLSPEERHRRAEAGLKCHMAKLARKSALARRSKAGTKR